MARTVFQAKRKPGTKIYQSFRSEGAPAPIESDLPSKIIGPQFAIASDEYIGAYSGAESVLSYPENILPTSKVDTTSVEVVLKNVVLQIASSVSATILTGNQAAYTRGTDTVDGNTVSTITHAVDDHFEDVLVNDTLTFSYIYNTVTYSFDALVTEIGVDGDVITLDRKLPNLPTGVSTFTITIKRASGEITDDTLDDAETDVFLEALPNDEFIITSPVDGIVKGIVKKVNSVNQLILDKDLTSTTNITYKVIRKNASVTEVFSGLGTIDPLDGNYLLGSGFITEEVKYGDLIRISQGNTLTLSTIIKEDINELSEIVVSNTKIKLNDEFNKAEGVSFYIYRMQQANSPVTLNPDSPDSHFVATESDITIIEELEISGNAVLSADVYVSVIALETKNSGKTVAITDSADLTTFLGTISKQNPLALGMACALANTLTTVYATAIKEDTNLGWLEAFEQTEKDKVHSIAPLTQNATYIGYGITHVSAMSNETEKKWRMIWFNLPHPYEDVIVTEKYQGKLSYTHVGTHLYITDATGDFSEVEIGNFVTFVANANTSGQTSKMRSYEVTEKVNKTKLKLNPKAYTAAGKGVYDQDDANIANADFTAYGDYSISSVLDIENQSQAIANIAFSYRNRRAVYITNDECVISLNNVNELLPGYYFSAAYAGLVSRLYPHQMLTSYPLQGFIGVRKGYDHFNDKQIGQIASGGGMTVVQARTDNSVPSAWIDTTTDTTSNKTSWISFTRNLDDISYGVDLSIFGMPGTRSRVTNSLTKMSEKINTYLNSKRDIERVSDFADGDLGPQIESYTFSGLIKSPTISNLITGDIDVFLPDRLDYVDLNIFG